MNVRETLNSFLNRQPRKRTATHNRSRTGSSNVRGPRQYTSTAVTALVTAGVIGGLLLGLVIAGRPSVLQSPRRVAILIPGINSESVIEHSDDEAASFHQIQQLLKRSQRYHDVLVFSYQCGSVTKAQDGKLLWSPTPYSYQHTFPKLDTSAAHLRCLASAYTNAAAPQPVQIDLIGFSLGGVVALRFMEQDGLQSGTSVKRVVTLSSPVRGIGPATVKHWSDVKAACATHLPCATVFGQYFIASFTASIIDIIFGPVGVGSGLAGTQRNVDGKRAIKLTNSPAANELRELGLIPDRSHGRTSTVIQGLRQRGIQVWTYVNDYDTVVMPDDAGLKDTIRQVKRGSAVTPVTAHQDVHAWLDQVQSNHSAITRILASDPEAARQKAMLCQDLAITCSP